MATINYVPIARVVFNYYPSMVDDLDWLLAKSRLPIAAQIKADQRTEKRIKRQKWRNKIRNRR